MAYPIVVDLAVFQDSSEAYFKKLKGYGVKSAIIKLTEGTSYTSAKAAAQISNAYKVFGSVAAYHYYLGNPLAEAKYFLSKVKAYGLDKSTWLAIDVEDPSLPKHNTAGINIFLRYLKAAGYTNLLCYASGSWFTSGRIDKNALVSGTKLWVAAYGVSQPGVNDTAIWQYTNAFKGLSQDASYDFKNLIAGNTRNTEKPSYYAAKGLYEVITPTIHAYNKLPLRDKRYVRFSKGSRFYAVPVKNGSIYSLKTAKGYVTANAKYVKLIKKL